MTGGIPWAEPVSWGLEKAFLLEALNSNWLSGGPFVDAFERGFQERFGFQHAISTSNGTSAIQASFLALGLKPHDEVLLPGFGFHAAANVALQMGIVPRFVEVNASTWCLDPQSVANAISSRTKCIVATHTYGNVCDMAALMNVSVDASIPILEDSAEALGSTLQGTYAGGLSQIGTFSFQATKTLSTGEGGMVVCQDPGLADRLRLYRNHGMGSIKYLHKVPGNNFRLTNLQAALGCAQLVHLDKAIRAKARIYEHYKSFLGSTPGLQFQTFHASVAPVVWATAIWIDREIHAVSREEVIRKMREVGIETRPGFYAASQIQMYESPPLPICESLSRNIVVLPNSPKLTLDQVERVSYALLNSLG